MNIVLTGFMGTGKSTVGRRVAETLGVSFIDVDETIQRKAGRSISDIFADSGEKAFRELENATIRELSGRDRVVISTGGGALLNPENRATLAQRGLLVCLRAERTTLLERLKDDLTRPLLKGEHLPDKLARLLREREAIYDQCPVQIATDDKTIEQVAEDVIRQTAPQWGSAS